MLQLLCTVIRKAEDRIGYFLDRAIVTVVSGKNRRPRRRREDWPVVDPTRVAMQALSRCSKALPDGCNGKTGKLTDRLQPEHLERQRQTRVDLGEQRYGKAGQKRLSAPIDDRHTLAVVHQRGKLGDQASRCDAEANANACALIDLQSDSVCRFPGISPQPLASGKIADRLPRLDRLDQRRILPENLTGLLPYQLVVSKVGNEENRLRAVLASLGEGHPRLHATALSDGICFSNYSPSGVRRATNDQGTEAQLQMISFLDGNLEAGNYAKIDDHQRLSSEGGVVLSLLEHKFY